MKPSGQILIGETGSILWIRVEGRGTFQISSPIKDFVEAESSAGRSEYVIDLEACPGMDSTFMGMLAGIGMRIKKKGRGGLSIVGTSQKNRDSLEELGLDYLMEIEPSNAPWSNGIESIRSGLSRLEDGLPSSNEAHILECHENLCDADESNAERFKTVLEVMGSKKVTPASGKRD